MSERGRVVLREEDPFYRSLIEGLLACVGVRCSSDGDVLVAPGNPSDSGRFRTFVRLEKPLSPDDLLVAIEAAL